MAGSTGAAICSPYDIYGEAVTVLETEDALHARGGSQELLSRRDVRMHDHLGQSAIQADRRVMAVGHTNFAEDASREMRGCADTGLWQLAIDRVPVTQRGCDLP